MLASGRGGMGVSQLNNSPLLKGLENRYGQKMLFSHGNFTIMGAKMVFSHYARGLVLYRSTTSPGAWGAPKNPSRNAMKIRWSKGGLRSALWGPMERPREAFWAILESKGSQNEAPGVTFEGRFWYFLGVPLKN